MKYLIFVFLLVCQLASVKGQYTFTTEMNTYEELQDPISLDEGQDWNEGTNFSVLYNFDFVISGQTHTALNVIAGGGITFPGFGQKQLFVFHTPFGGYMLTDNNSSSQIDYEITGTTGEQILKIQWKNAGFIQSYPESDPTDYIDFQVWIFEEDDHIEVRFGNSSTDPGTYGYPTGTSDSNPGTSFKFLFDTCAEMFGLQGAADLPSYWFFDSCNPNYTFIDGTPSSEMTYILNPIPTATIDLEKINFSTYPNPINEGDFINIELETETAFEATIEIYSTSGQQLIRLEKQKFQQGINAIQLANNNLIKGVYILRIQSDEEMINHKFFVQ